MKEERKENRAWLGKTHGKAMSPVCTGLLPVSSCVGKGRCSPRVFIRSGAGSSTSTLSQGGRARGAVIPEAAPVD